MTLTGTLRICSALVTARFSRGVITEAPIVSRHLPITHDVKRKSWHTSSLGIALVALVHFASFTTYHFVTLRHHQLSILKASKLLNQHHKVSCDIPHPLNRHVGTPNHLPPFSHLSALPPLLRRCPPLCHRRERWRHLIRQDRSYERANL